ncbi:hypothetical protein QR680_017134 [Steinernema hermaphroditum]|uniref:Protein kinase domain-containing protein n=1 Tax=Steinernema hermaphroditum TaxID=289476 RepID=A0AA39HFG5_9BILA|nr:hypothetical protein QR680_017134 [Steinernema hermaphroditum]
MSLKTARKRPLQETKPPPKKRVRVEAVDSQWFPCKILGHITTNPKNDEEGYLVFKKGEVILKRFQLLTEIGEGTFGRVLKVFDARDRRYKALKIIKNEPRYRDAGLHEAKVLMSLNRKDPKGRYLIVDLREHFQVFGHVCLVFDWLGLSVFQFMENNNFQPYSIDHTRHIVHQLCRSVKFMHDNGVIHTDLKPENVLFVKKETHNGGRKNLNDSTVKLIDLGSAVFDRDRHPTTVSTRHYRAPEVILQLDWSFPCDVWSIGCIIYELHLGEVLFQTHEDLEHLAMMEAVLGPMPTHMIKEAKTNFYNKPNCRLNWDEDSPTGREVLEVCRPLTECMNCGDEEEYEMLDLMQRMLTHDPGKRITLTTALNHPFFKRLTH